MLEQSLLYDGKGKPLPQQHKNSSQDWDEIKFWSDQVYMPYRAHPIGHYATPQSSMHSVKVASMIVTRFKYGVPVHLNQWDQAAGNIILLTTIQGAAKHAVNSRQFASTKIGESFLVDCSQTDDYAVSFDPLHLQLNLTIPHQVLSELVIANFGHHAPMALWQLKTVFGGADSTWLLLLQYLSKSIAEISQQQLQSRAGEHLQQMIGLHILNEWAARANIDLTRKENISPGYIERAEQYMEAFLHLSPTIAEIAQAVGVSIRTLNHGFKKYRDITPSHYIRNMRLQKVRYALLNAEPNQSVASIAYQFGYINLGDFARQYRQKYAELPSQTLKK